MAEPRIRRFVPRNALIALLVLVLIYALAGFVLLPWWLTREVPGRLEQLLGWQASVENIAINPFAISLEITGLDASDSDGNRVLALDRAYVNVGLWQLVRGVTAIETIEVDEPYIRLDLLDDYSVNFRRDWFAHNPPAAEATPVEPDADSAPPKLYFGRVALNGGELLFRDFTQTTPAEFRVTPLDLTLTDLATFPRDGDGSDYVVTAALGQQTIHWQGSLTVTPMESTGFISVSNVDYATLAHFLRPYLPYELVGGKVTVATDYDFRIGDEMWLETSSGKVSVRDLALAVAAGDTPADPATAEIRTASIDLEQLAFSLGNREAGVGVVRLDGVGLRLLRDAEGQLNLLAPLDRPDEGAGDKSDGGNGQAPAAAGGESFRWSVDAVELSNGAVVWRDEALPETAELTLDGISLSLGRLSDELAEPLPYQFAANLASGGQLSAQGQATLAPFTLEAGLSASGVTLAAFEPYLKTATNLAIRGGQLTVDGNLDLDGQKDPLTGTFNGTGEVQGLDLRLTDSREPLLAWQSLRLAPIEYNIAPARLEIGRVTVKGPRASVIRAVSGSHNVERIMRSAGTGDAAAAGPEDDSPGLIFRVGELQLEDGAVSYTDRTLAPVFATRFDQLNGTVTGLSNISPQQGTVLIKGKVGELSRLTFEGALGTLGTEDTSDLKMRLEDLSLPVLSPYFGRYLGYAVDGGKMALNLDYKIAGSRIDASNLVIMDQLELGSEVPSEEAVNAPVRLGLALLRDSDGLIEIDVPISGDLADPEFSVGRVVMRAFVNLLAKAATSPFSALGSIAELAGLSGEELGQVHFSPGVASLATAERSKLDVLAKALKERPQLLLNVRGAVVPSLDGAALRRQQLEQQLGLGGLSTAQRLPRLEQAYRNAGASVPLDQLRQQSMTEVGGSLSDQRWVEILSARLAEDIPLPPEALGNLAVARGEWLQRSLLTDYGIPSGQLFLLDPRLNGAETSNGLVEVQFSLDAR